MHGCFTTFAEKQTSSKSQSRFLLINNLNIWTIEQNKCQNQYPSKAPEKERQRNVLFSVSFVLPVPFSWTFILYQILSFTKLCWYCCTYAITCSQHNSGTLLKIWLNIFTYQAIEYIYIYGKYKYIKSFCLCQYIKSLFLFDFLFLILFCFNILNDENIKIFEKMNFYYMKNFKEYGGDKNN